MGSAKSGITQKLALAALGIAVAVVIVTGRAQAQPADMDALVKAAKAEGELTFYTVSTDNVGRRVAETFGAKYGIKTQFLRFGSTPLQLRYASEAESGNIAADVLMTTGDSAAFVKEASTKGWIVPLDQMNLSAVKSGEFPARFIRDQYVAVIAIYPWLLGYNTDKVKGADIPKEYADVLNPKFQDQVIMPDPGVSDSYLAMWQVMLDKYGEGFFDKLRAMNPRRFKEGQGALQALAAGEGSVQLPVVGSQVDGFKSKGAPVDTVTPSATSGIEIQLLATNPAKAKHPNAGRLLANYILSKEGNAVYNADPGSINPSDTNALPKEYQSPAPGASAHVAEFRKRLGFQ